MELSKILSKLKDGGVQEFGSVYKAIDSSTFKSLSSGSNELYDFFLKCVRCICCCMKSTENISSSDEELTVKLLEKICLSLVNLSKDSNMCKETTLERSLYHIIYNFVKMSAHSASIKIAYFLHNFLLKRLKHADKDKKIVNELVTVIQSSYLVLWNSAVKLDNKKYNPTKMIQLALQLRTEATKFLLLDYSKGTENTERVLSKVTSASQAFMFSAIELKMDPQDLDITSFFSDIIPFLYEWTSIRNMNFPTEGYCAIRILLECQIDHIKHLNRANILNAVWSAACKAWMNQDFFLFSLKPKFMTSICNALSFLQNFDKTKAKYITDIINAFKQFSSFNVASSQSICLLSMMNLSITYIKLSIRSNEYLEKLLKSKSALSLLKYLHSAICFVQEIESQIDEQSFITLLNAVKKNVACISANIIKNVLTKEGDEYCHKVVEGVKAEILSIETLIRNHIIDSKDNQVVQQLGNDFTRIGAYYYQHGLFNEALPSFQMACQLKNLSLSKIEDKENEINSLVKTYDLLAYCQRKSGDLASSLKTLCNCMILSPESVSSCMERWVRIKYDANANNNTEIQLMTVKKVMSQLKVKADTASLLECELNALKSQKYDTSDECFEIICDLFEEVPKNSVLQAKTFVELAKLLWKKNYKADCTAVEACEKAINILNRLIKKKSKDADLVKYHLGNAYFYLYMIQLQETQAKAEQEVCENDIIPLEKLEENQSPSQRDVDQDENDTCDVTPAHSTILIDAEFKSCKNSLDKALSFWWDLLSSRKVTFIDDLGKAEIFTFVDNLKGMAEVYCGFKRCFEELCCWSMTELVSERTGLLNDQIYASSRHIYILCKLRNQIAAEALYEKLESVVSAKFKMDTSSYTKCVHFMYLFASAHLKFYSSKFEECCYDLKLLMEHPVMDMQTKQAYILQSEANIFFSHFFMLNPNLTNCSKIFNDEKYLLPVYLCTKAVDVSVWLVKAIKEEQQENFRDPIGIRHRIVNLLIDSCLSVGKMYIFIGAVREARCFLKEGLAVAQKFALAFRTAEALLAMVETDLLCDMSADANVKLRGISYILSKNVPSKEASYDDEIASESSDEENFLVTKAGRRANIQLIMRDKSENVNMASPEFQQQNIRQRSILPDFVYHSADCACEKCSHILLKEIVIEYMSLLGESYILEDYCNEATTLFVKSESLSKKFMNQCSHLFSNIMIDCPSSIAKQILNISDKIEILKFKNNLKYISLLIKQRDYSMCLKQIKSLSTSLNKWDIFMTAINSTWICTLKYYHCVVSLICKAKENQSLCLKIYDSNWNYLVPNYADGVNSKSTNIEHHSVNKELFNSSEFKTPIKAPSMSRINETKMKKNFNAPVKKGSNLSIHSYNDDVLNIAFTSEETDVHEINESEIKPVIKLRSRRIASNKIEKMRSTTPLRPSTKDNIYTPNVTKKRTRKKLSNQDSSPNNTKSQTLKSGKIDIFNERSNHAKLKELDEEEILLTLKEIFHAMRHYPPALLYSNVCLLLSLCFGNKLKDVKENNSSFYLSESTSVTLRHISLSTMLRKHKKKVKLNHDSSNEDPSTCSKSSIKLSSAYEKNFEVLNFNVEKITELSSQIPEGWTVVQIDSIPSIETFGESTQQLFELYVTQFKSASEPVTVKLDISSNQESAFGFQDHYPNLLSEFSSILEGNISSMKTSNKKEWWTQRIHLDSRMKNLTNDLENIWLKHWKGMLLGQPYHSEDKKRLDQAVSQAKKALNKLGIVADSNLLQTAIDSVPWLTQVQFDDAISCLTQLQVVDTKFKEASCIVRKYAKNVNSLLFQRNLIVLVLGKNVQYLPWECMPIINLNPVSRMPSLHITIAHLIHVKNAGPNVYSQGIDSQNTYYILNPGTDLNFTQEFFHEPFKNAGWSGTMGRVPTCEEFSLGLRDHDLFIYCGHGCGGAYLAGEHIRKLDCRAAALLLGCSSGKLKCLGSKLEPVGMVHQYLLSGCPSVMGNLWDVTDRDIDTYLNELLQKWLPSWKNQRNELHSLSEQKVMITRSMQEARNACKLKFMIGCAPVIYGLPVYCLQN